MPDSSPTSSRLPATAFTPSRQANGWTSARQRGFCEVLAGCGNVEQAAASQGMTRQGAYAFRNSSAGQAFALGWDAALLLARQMLIDDVYQLAFQGSVEQIYRDGKLYQEKRRRDPKMLLATIERLGSRTALGSAPVQAAAQEFSTFLDVMQAEADGARGASAHFMECRADWGGALTRTPLQASSALLERAARRTPALAQPAASPQITGQRSP